MTEPVDPRIDELVTTVNKANQLLRDMWDEYKITLDVSHRPSWPHYRLKVAPLPTESKNEAADVSTDE